MSNRKDHMKRLYSNTLLELCETQPLASITVTCMVAATNTARQTFYNHFKDMNDLVSFLPSDYLRSKSMQIHDPEGTRAAYTYALEHKAFFSQLPYHAGQNNFRASFILWLEQEFYKQYLTADLGPEECLRRTMAIDLYVSGVTDLFLEWCKVGLSWPIEMMIEVQSEATPSFITASV